MYQWLLKHVLLVRKALPGGGDSPRQLAMGLALGLLLGLVPKGNLTAAIISVFIFASTVNLGIALLTALAVSFAGPLIDPLTDHMGSMILTHEQLQPYGTWLYDMPVIPWTDLNNTVVMGSFALGLLLLVPSYLISRRIFQRYWVKSAQTADEAPPKDPPTEVPETPESTSADQDTDYDHETGHEDEHETEQVRDEDPTEHTDGTPEASPSGPIDKPLAVPLRRAA